MALVQTSLKRMLAYSSIAHSGYMAVAICAIGGVGEEFPLVAILFYVASYTVISMGTFGIIMWLENDHFSSIQLSDLRGLYKKHPLASFALAVFMFSFAGMPPTVGFMAKFFVFNAALTNNFYSLVIIGVIGSFDFILLLFESNSADLYEERRSGGCRPTNSVTPTFGNGRHYCWCCCRHSSIIRHYFT